MTAPNGSQHKLGGWYLEGFSENHDRLRSIALTHLPFRIGRQSDLSLNLNSQEISRVHAEIFRDHSNLRIRDLGSTNGTFLNYRRLEEPATLADGDIIHFGKLEFRIAKDSIDFSHPDDVTAVFHGELPKRLAPGTRQLQKMIAGKAVTAHFQPLVELENGKTFGYEILGRGTLPGFASDPVKLFQIATSINKAADLSRLFRWIGIEIGATLPGHPVLFINTHPSEMYNLNQLTESLQSLRSEFATLPVTLEIHERAVTDLELMRSLRSLLQELDMRLAYDDFGAGQARLLELVEVPPDYLKIDRSLIRNIHLAPRERRRMIAMFVQFARESGVKTLAEGICCAEEEKICRHLNFDYAQGFFYGEPLPKDAI
ncbi:MAG: EAL domain-containing protein [Desulfobacterales bacterium]|jgi:EAL domain-containing protein (putative c-di-GMP-specific phosphodiesterase class I)